MTGDDLVAALDPPAAALVDRRVPKALLLEHGAPTAADRRRINEGIEQIQWVAALKPTTIGVAAYRDETREYLEIAVLRMVLRSDAQESRVIALLHRAVPYPVVAIVEQGEGANMSLAHIRWSQGEAGKTVIEGNLVSCSAPRHGDPHEVEFAAALGLGRQPRATLFALYQGWLDTVLALEAARRTGRFAILPTAESRTARSEALRECIRLEAEMSRLRAAAAREKQMPRQIELNLRVRDAEAAYAAAGTRL